MFKITTFITVLSRIVRIIFRNDRKLRRLKLHYTNEHQLANSVLVINYRFQNALYYKLENYITTEKHKVAIDISKLNGPLKFKVVGVFSSKEYHIHVAAQRKAETAPFTAGSKLQLV